MKFLYFLATTLLAVSEDDLARAFIDQVKQMVNERRFNSYEPISAFSIPGFRPSSPPNTATPLYSSPPISPISHTAGTIKRAAVTVIKPVGKSFKTSRKSVKLSLDSMEPGEHLPKFNFRPLSPTESVFLKPEVLDSPKDTIIGPKGIPKSVEKPLQKSSIKQTGFLPKKSRRNSMASLSLLKPNEEVVLKQAPGDFKSRTPSPIMQTEYEKLLDAQEEARKKLLDVEFKVFGRFLLDSERTELRKSLNSELDALNSKNMQRLSEASHYRSQLIQKLANRFLTVDEDYQLYFATFVEMNAEKEFMKLNKV